LEKKGSGRGGGTTKTIYQKKAHKTKQTKKKTHEKVKKMHTGGKRKIGKKGEKWKPRRGVFSHKRGVGGVEQPVQGEKLKRLWGGEKKGGGNIQRRARGKGGG